MPRRTPRRDRTTPEAVPHPDAGLLAELAKSNERNRMLCAHLDESRRQTDFAKTALTKTQGALATADNRITGLETIVRTQAHELERLRAGHDAGCGHAAEAAGLRVQLAAMQKQLDEYRQRDEDAERAAVLAPLGWTPNRHRGRQT